MSWDVINAESPGRTMLERLNRGEEVGDFKLKSRDGTQRSVQKLVLREASEYFANLVSDNFKGGEASLPVDTPVLNCIISFIYTNDNSSLGAEYAFALCLASRQYGLHSLCSQTREFILRNILVCLECQSFLHFNPDDLLALMDIFKDDAVFFSRFAIQKRLYEWQRLSPTEERKSTVFSICDELMAPDDLIPVVFVTCEMEDTTIKVFELRGISVEELKIDCMDSDLRNSSRVAILDNELLVLTDNSLKTKTFSGDIVRECPFIGAPNRGICVFGGNIYLWKGCNVYILENNRPQFISIGDGIIKRLRVLKRTDGLPDYVIHSGNFLTNNNQIKSTGGAVFCEGAYVALAGTFKSRLYTAKEDILEVREGRRLIASLPIKTSNHTFAESAGGIIYFPFKTRVYAYDEMSGGESLVKLPGRIVNIKSFFSGERRSKRFVLQPC